MWDTSLRALNIIRKIFYDVICAALPRWVYTTAHSHLGKAPFWETPWQKVALNGHHNWSKLQSNWDRKPDKILHVIQSYEGNNIKMEYLSFQSVHEFILALHPLIREFSPLVALWRPSDYSKQCSTTGTTTRCNWAICYQPSSINYLVRLVISFSIITIILT